MRVTKETITPKKAAEYLKLNVCNRPLSRSYSEFLGQIMTENKFRTNADAIRFANLENGNGEVLIDGQHRLTAAVISGKSFTTLVARGLSKEDFDSIDQGRKRTISDTMARRGEENYVHLASALYQLRNLQQGYHNFHGRLRPDQANELLEKHPTLRESVSFIRSLPTVFRLCSTGMAAALHYLFTKKDKDLADLFFQSLNTGADLKAGHPIYRLRETLLRAAASRTQKMAPTATCALLIKSWNFVRNKQTVKSLQWKNSEEFPEIQ